MSDFLRRVVSRIRSSPSDSVCTVCCLGQILGKKKLNWKQPSGSLEACEEENCKLLTCNFKY